MKSIGSFQITGMTISGFKCYEEAAHLTFGNPRSSLAATAAASPA